MTPMIGPSVTSSPSAVSFHRPTLTRRDLQSVLDALVEEEITTGNQVKNFEKELASTLEVNYAVALSSYAAGYHMALLANGIQAGQEVILPSTAPLAALDGISYIGAKPVLVDLARSSFHPDPTDIESKITDNTRAIILHYPFGSYFNYRAMVEKVKQDHTQIKIIEDISTMLCTDIEGKYLGNDADAAILGLNKEMPATIGKGAALFFDSKTVYQNLKEIRNEGYQKPYKVRYDYSITDYQAAMGLEQIAQQAQNMDRRKKIGNKYLESCRKAGIETYFNGQGKDSFAAFAILCPESNQKTMRQFKSMGIETKNLFDHEGLHNLLQLDSSEFRNTERIIAKGLLLPLYPLLSRVHIERVTKGIQKLS